MDTCTSFDCNVVLRVTMGGLCTPENDCCSVVCYPTPYQMMCMYVLVSLSGSLPPHTYTHTLFLM